MCGIFGYVGVPVQVVPMVSGALKTMEYRVYDSWGTGWDNGESLKSEEAIGRVPDGLKSPSLTPLAIGHTRRATHGVVTECNTHPHFADGVLSHSHIIPTGCGPAYAVSLGAEWFRSAISSWIDVLPASELDAHTGTLGDKTLVLDLTQSGETADAVDALHVARPWGVITASLVNTELSTMAKTVDLVVPIIAGTERSVPATKFFIAMVVRLLQLAESLSWSTDSTSLQRAVLQIERVMHCEELDNLAYRIQFQDHVLTLGMGIGHKVALEAAVKIKEGRYAHAEAFMMGELKHGPLALVSDGTPCSVFATTPKEVSDARTTVQEILTRRGMTIGIGACERSDCSMVLTLPYIGTATPWVHVVLAQKLA